MSNVQKGMTTSTSSSSSSSNTLITIHLDVMVWLCPHCQAGKDIISPKVRTDSSHDDDRTVNM
jgi:hypothetical protein